MIRVGLDAMGGDFAPKAAVKGAVMALEALGDECRVVLFGDREPILHILASEGCPADRFDIVATSEVIEMGDHPAKAFQGKPSSSITVGFDHLGRGLIDGFASAGSTGAMMVGSMLVAKPVEGVLRPTIATAVQTLAGSRVVILDIGLNVDCRAEVLEQYALLGSVYAEAVLGIEHPRVALLNIGEEPSKGNAQVKASYDLMLRGSSEGRYNFVGNVEASHIFTGDVADVVVCDGFTGNTILKLCEGLYAINLAKGVKNDFWEGMNYERTGGTPVLGINGVVTIGHGKSTPLAVRNMILATRDAIRSGLVERLQSRFR
ncbi:MAG: phosphate acyltransferase [Alistipes sp.]|nr:phosphate acyltransferase [Alistipes sp.]